MAAKKSRSIFKLSGWLIAACILFGLTIAAISARPDAQGGAQESGESEPKAIHLDAATLDSYQGEYRFVDDPDDTVSFYRKDNHLYSESARKRTRELFAESKNSFFVKDDPMRFVFAADANDKVISVTVIFGTRELEAKKISDQPVRNHFRPYDRREVMIPMRDGVKLHAIVLRPTDTKSPLPFLMQRTPYGVDGSNSDSINARYTELAESGYIFVMEDIRGRYKSQGQFVMMRPLADHSDPKQIDESTDTYDTVAWLVKDVPNNSGRAGVLGISYPGFLAAEASIDPHPAVKAVSPQAPMTDVWMGDDFFHNGAFRQSYGYDYALGMESSKENTFGQLDTDAYDYFLQAGSFAEAAKKSGSSILPSWKSFLENPSYVDFWKARAVQPHLTRVAVPTLEVGGFWDQEDMWGPQAEYATLKPRDKKGEVFLALGPWNHGQWSATTSHLGAINFGAPVGDQFRRQIEAPFFAHYLKDEELGGMFTWGTGDKSDTASFQTGSNHWMRYTHWPPPEGIETRNLYFGDAGSLSFSKPGGDDAASFTTYTSDPANPVPYRKRPIEATYSPNGSGWYEWLVQDQRFLEGRKDVVSWSTPALDHSVTVTGDVAADLFASTSGADSDWVVKLIDVYPDGADSSDPQTAKMSGYQLMIADEIFRGRYRKSYEKPEALKPGEINEFKFSLHAADHVFLKGHRIMVQVQSSWFPLYDRNPQTFVPNIMTAAPDDYQPATQRIYWSGKYSSHLELPVATR